MPAPGCHALLPRGARHDNARLWWHPAPQCPGRQQAASLQGCGDAGVPATEDTMAGWEEAMGVGLQCPCPRSGAAETAG